MERAAKSEIKSTQSEKVSGEKSAVKTEKKTEKVQGGKSAAKLVQSEKMPGDKSEVAKADPEPAKRVGGKRMPKKATEDEFAKGPFVFLYTLAWVGLVWILGLGFGSGLTYLHYLRLGEAPVYFGQDSFIGGTPRLIYEPNPAIYDKTGHGAIQWKPNEDIHKDKDEYNLIWRLGVILKEYKVRDYDLADRHDNSSTRIPRVHCSNFTGYKDGAPVNSSCLLDLESEDYGPCALTDENMKQSMMGYAEGKPCVMFRLTKLLGWYPEVDEVDHKSKRQCPNEEKDCCHRRRITVQCDGAPFQMYPEDGMDTCAFPYWNQQGYQAPFVMLKFNLTGKGEHSIRCRTILKGAEAAKGEVKFKIRMK